jgi:hypothetical protein
MYGGLDNLNKIEVLFYAGTLAFFSDVALQCDSHFLLYVVIDAY